MRTETTSGSFDIRYKILGLFEINPYFGTQLLTELFLLFAGIDGNYAEATYTSVLNS